MAAHPKMFDDNDPYLAKVREIAFALPETDEKVSHGRPTFFTKKVFCYYGGSVKVNDKWVQHPQSILVQPDSDERVALLEDERAYIPAYLGPYGWVGIDLDDSTDWTEIAELLEDSFRQTALKRAIKALDAAQSD